MPIQHSPATNVAPRVVRVDMNREQTFSISRSRSRSPTDLEKAGPSPSSTAAKPTNVRRSIGEIEDKIESQQCYSATHQHTPPTAGARVASGLPPRTRKLRDPTSPGRATTKYPQGIIYPKEESEGLSPVTLENPARVTDTVARARAWAVRAKCNVNQPNNFRKDLRDSIIRSVDALYEIVKSLAAKTASETSKSINKQRNVDRSAGKEKEGTGEKREVRETEDSTNLQKELLKRMGEHSKQIEKNRVEMERLREAMERKHVEVEAQVTYASVAAAAPSRRIPEHSAVHSVVVTSVDETETGDEVLEKVRQTVNAKDEGFQIDRIRKGRDRKIILGCKTKTEVNRIKEKLRKDGKNLKVEEMKNKDPLIIIKNIFKYNEEEDIIKAIRTQNREIVKGLKDEDDRIAVRYRKTSRNPHQMHVVLSVSPQLWNRLTRADCVHIDMQRLKAEDQSPLIQCTRCLGYGHSKKMCRETEDACSHCGGPHLRTECANWIAAVAPTCRNCEKANIDTAEHNAFSTDCPIRKKWETLARSTVAYC